MHPGVLRDLLLGPGCAGRSRTCAAASACIGVALAIVGCAAEPASVARHWLGDGYSDDAVLRVARVTDSDGLMIHEVVSGSADAIALVEEGGYAMALELGSTDGEHTTAVFAVERDRCRVVAGSAAGRHAQ